MILARLLKRYVRMATFIATAFAAPYAHAAVDIVDVLGRHLTLQQPAQHVMLGFYFEDYIAITGPTAIDRLAAVSLNY